MSNTVNLLENIAEKFSSSKDYSSGDYVLYEDLLYVFSTNHSAGTFNIDEVNEVILTDIMKGIVNKDNLNELNILSSSVMALFEANTFKVNKTNCFIIVNVDVLQQRASSYGTAAEITNCSLTSDGNADISLIDDVSESSNGLWGSFGTVQETWAKDTLLFEISGASTTETFTFDATIKGADNRPTFVTIIEI